MNPKNSSLPQTDVHCDCGCSTGICGYITRGTGKLDFNGYWEFPCPHGNDRVKHEDDYAHSLPPDQIEDTAPAVSEDGPAEVIATPTCYCECKSCASGVHCNTCFFYGKMRPVEPAAPPVAEVAAPAEEIRSKFIDYDARRESKTDIYCVLCQRDLKSGETYRRIFFTGAMQAIHPDDVHLVKSGEWGRIGLDCSRRFGMGWTVKDVPTSPVESGETAKPTERGYPQAEVCRCSHQLMNHCPDGCVMCLCLKFELACAPSPSPVEEVGDAKVCLNCDRGIEKSESFAITGVWIHSASGRNACDLKTTYAEPKLPQPVTGPAEEEIYKQAGDPRYAKFRREPIASPAVVSEVALPEPPPLNERVHTSIRDMHRPLHYYDPEEVRKYIDFRERQLMDSLAKVAELERTLQCK